MMNRNHQHARQLLTLLHISDSAFPTGAFGHSFGLEFAITKRWVKGLHDLLDFSKEILVHSLIKGDCVFLSLASVAARNRNLDKIKQLDECCRAYRPSLQVREASAQIGRSMISLLCEVYSSDFLSDVTSFVLSENDYHPIQHSVAWGVAGGLLDLESPDIVLSFLSGFFRQWAQVAVRILPLGQRESQVYIQKMNEEILQELSCFSGEVTLEQVSQCTLGYDMAQVGHEFLHARYFRS